MEQKSSAKLTKNAAQLAELQLSFGGEAHWEHPLDALLWKLASSRELTGHHHYTRLHGCTVGARAADTKDLILKPLCILISDILMHAARSIRCIHGFKHRPLLGGASCAQSAFYPETMCRRICKEVLEHLIWKLRNCMRANDVQPTASAYPAPNVPLSRRDQGFLDLEPGSRFSGLDRGTPTEMSQQPVSSVSCKVCSFSPGGRMPPKHLGTSEQVSMWCLS